MITSPSFSETLPAGLSQEPLVTREAYLVNLLANQTVDPVRKYPDTAHIVISENMRKFGNVKLKCLVVLFNGSDKFDEQYCTDPGSQELRVALNHGSRSLARNQLETYMNTGIARDETIAFGGVIAIKGHIDLIEAVEAEKASLEIGPAADTKHPNVTLPRRTHFVPPSYPPQEASSRTGGVVTVRSLISKEGRVASLEIVASPGSDFSQSVLDAMKQWVYMPMLRDGIPSDMDVTVTTVFLPGDSNHSSRQILMLDSEMDPEAR